MSRVAESSLLNNENSRMIENKTNPPQALEIFDSLSASYGFSFKVRGESAEGDSPSLVALTLLENRFPSSLKAL